jgi:hypothetical protein
VKAVALLQGRKVWAETRPVPTQFKDVGDMPRQDVAAWVEGWRQDQEELDRILSGQF